MKEKIIKSFDNEKIWYRVLGEGEHCLVLADGIACSGFIWKYIIPYFEKRFKIIHFNYRGHGKTPAPKSYDNLTVETLAKDINVIMEKEKVEKAILLGHSMGVQVIYEFYKQFPSKVSALVPICGSYGRPFDSYHNTDKFTPVFKFMIKYVFKPYGVLLRNFQQLMFENNFSYYVVSNVEVNGKMLHKEDFMDYLRDIKETLDFTSFGYLLESSMNHTALNILPEIDVPVLIIAGERDRMTPSFLSTKMYKLIPDARLESIKWGSHTTPIEQPEMSNLLIEDFLISNNFC